VFLNHIHSAVTLFSTTTYGESVAQLLLVPALVVECKLLLGRFNCVCV
jgi:hypothetical protein